MPKLTKSPPKKQRETVINPVPSLLPNNPKAIYRKGFADAKRLFDHPEPDLQRLQIMREYVEQYRKKLKKRGTI
jgi:hypothetical protein